MRTENKKHKEAQPGLWPAGQTRNGLEKSLLFYNPNQATTHNHLNRFFEYIEMAEPSRALAVMTKLFFAYHTLPKAGKIFSEEDLDEFALLTNMLADIAIEEGRYLAADREDLLRELYGNYNPEGGSNV